MAESEITRSDFVHAMMHVGQLLTGPKPYDQRMAGFCATVGNVLQCHQASLFQLDGDVYQPAFRWGPLLRPVDFPDGFKLDRSRDEAQILESCETYILVTWSMGDTHARRSMDLFGLKSVVIVPLKFPDGSPLGYMTAAWQEERARVTSEQAEVATGLARMAETTMLRRSEQVQRQRLSRAMLTAADTERERLSRDIYSDPLQRILGLRIGLESLHSTVDNEELQATLTDLVTQCRATSTGLREVLLRTHPTASELVDLHQALAAMIERHNADVTLRFADRREDGSPIHLISTLNRVAEQATRNTLHHADASVLSVTLTTEDMGTRMTISDDGCGFALDDVDPKRLGLVSMRERTELLGGNLRIESKPGRGTSLSAWLPHAEAEPTP